MRTIRNRNDFVVGAGYIVAGAFFAIASRSYEMGTASDAGAGYFPFWLGVVLVGLGLAVVLRATDRRADAVSLEAWDWRSLLWIIGSIVLFGVLLQWIGLVLALIPLVVLSSRASHEFTWKGALLGAALLIGINVGVFVHVLELPLPIWPAFVRP